MHSLYPGPCFLFLLEVNCVTEESAVTIIYIFGKNSKNYGFESLLEITKL